jgi:hypothetical protein
MMRLAAGEFVPLEIERPDLGALARVVGRAMAHDRAARYQSARELREELQAALVAERTTIRSVAPSSVGPPLSEEATVILPGGLADAPTVISRTGAPSIDPSARRSSAWLAFGIAIAIASIAGASAVWSTASDTHRPERPAPPSPRAPQSITVRLKALPADSVVRVDGRDAPGALLVLPRDGRARHIVVEAQGRRRWHVAHDCLQSAEYEVVLPDLLPAPSAGEGAAPLATPALHPNPLPPASPTPRRARRAPVVPSEPEASPPDTSPATPATRRGRLLESPGI